MSVLRLSFIAVFACFSSVTQAAADSISTENNYIYSIDGQLRVKNSPYSQSNYRFESKNKNEWKEIYTRKPPLSTNHIKLHWKEMSSELHSIDYTIIATAFGFRKTYTLCSRTKDGKFRACRAQGEPVCLEMYNPDMKEWFSIKDKCSFSIGDHFSLFYDQGDSSLKILERTSHDSSTLLSSREMHELKLKIYRKKIALLQAASMSPDSVFYVENLPTDVLYLMISEMVLH